MAAQDMVRSDAPIRIFRSDMLEALTHIHPAAVLAVWVPVIGAFVFLSVTRPAPARGLFVPLCIAAGLFLWTLVEYTLHRFVFHFEPKSEGQKRLAFLAHGIHHAQPMVKSRLVMPFAMSVPLGLFFYGLLTLVFSVILGKGQWVAPLFAGLLAGYVTYDMTHYAAHHFRPRSGVLKAIRRSHMLHHGSTHDRRFGVTSPLWDYVFGTMPEKKGASAASAAGGGT